VCVVSTALSLLCEILRHSPALPLPANRCFLLDRRGYNGGFNAEAGHGGVAVGRRWHGVIVQTTGDEVDGTADVMGWIGGGGHGEAPLMGGLVGKGLPSPSSLCPRVSVLPEDLLSKFVSYLHTLWAFLIFLGTTLATHQPPQGNKKRESCDSPLVDRRGMIMPLYD
jgi:hypothetical protein